MRNKLLSKLLSWRMQSTSFVERRRACVSQASGATLEIGAGEGLNLPYYTNVSTLTLLEPNQNLQPENYPEYPFSISAVTGTSEKIPFPDNSFDSVVSTWVLCSVENVENAVNEIIRVLKPGGVYYFVEHGSSTHPMVRLLQSSMNPLWKKLALGCNLTRSYSEIRKLGNVTVQNFSHTGSDYSGAIQKPL